MKKISFILALVCLMIGVTPALAQQGKSCSNPIPLGKDYSATITKPQTVWYSANTCKDK